jgi:hypothetical protein
MAKQTGIFLLTGTLGNVTFYKMQGRFYARNKSSLQGKRVKTDPAFARTMQYADRLALSSRTASKLYRSLPKEQQEISVYRKMTSKAMGLLKLGVSAAQLPDALATVFSLLPSPVVVTGEGRLVNSMNVRLKLDSKALLQKRSFQFELRTIRLLVETENNRKFIM